MNTMTITSRAPHAIRRGLLTVPAVTGIAYSLSWMAGLSVNAPSPQVSAGGATVVAALAGHGAAVTAQFLFTEGLPAAGLAIVSLALARAGRWSGAARVAGITGIVAASISFVQAILGFALAGASAPGTAHLLFESVNRLDGVKMLVLAVLAVAAVATGLLPRWLRYIGFALAATIVGSGIGWLLLIPSVAILAYVAGPLLLVFITGTGILLGRTGR
jgi:hypothetical protein